jgi:hypothetical protein
MHQYKLRTTERSRQPGHAANLWQKGFHDRVLRERRESEAAACVRPPETGEGLSGNGCEVISGFRGRPTWRTSDSCRPPAEAQRNSLVGGGLLRERTGCVGAAVWRGLSYIWVRFNSVSRVLESGCGRALCRDLPSGPVAVNIGIRLRAKHVGVAGKRPEQPPPGQHCRQDQKATIVTSGPLGGWIACIQGARWLAVKKGHEPMAWAILALFTGTLSFLILLVVPRGYYYD